MCTVVESAGRLVSQIQEQTVDRYSHCSENERERGGNAHPRKDKCASGSSSASDEGGSMVQEGIAEPCVNIPVFPIEEEIQDVYSTHRSAFNSVSRSSCLPFRVPPSKEKSWLL